MWAILPPFVAKSKPSCVATISSSASARVAAHQYVVEGLRAAKQLGARTVARLGEHGLLADVAELAIRVPSQSVPRIQEAHMLIGHLIGEMAQRMTTGDYQTRFAPSAARS